MQSILSARCLTLCSGHLSGFTNPASSTDYKELIIGRWEGQCVENVMNLTFNKNGTVIIDYSSLGGHKFNLPYTFKDNRTLKIRIFPDDLVIDMESNDAMSFRTKRQKLRKHIALIYVCRFKRISR
jgi:hypothetical protein